jgi:hypothetical protein
MGPICGAPGGRWGCEGAVGALTAAKNPALPWPRRRYGCNHPATLAGTQPTSPADGGPVFDAAGRVLWPAQRPGSFGDIRDIRHNPWRAAQCFIGRARAGFPAFQGTNLHNRMSERGQSRLGGASCRSSHVRNAPLTTVGPKKAACRNGPQAAIPNLSWVKVLDGPVRLTWNSVWPEQSFRRES